MSSVLLGSCLEPYAPPGSGGNVDILVVDGFFNSTTGDVHIKLSHTKPIDSEEDFRPESSAQVTLESESGDQFDVSETNVGTYVRSGLAPDLNQRYRIKIKTNASKEYVSDFVELLQSPLIDSVTWAPKNGGVSIRVNTHDPTNQTVYYQWRYQETWKYSADYYSVYKMENGNAVLRRYDELLYFCWHDQPSKQILVGSSNRLSADVIRDFQINFLEVPSQKINLRYSILVQQNALSRDAYDFWSQLKQTTENMGGLFDPQPGKVVGNVHCVSDPNEPVLGYFGGGSTHEQRIFIDWKDLPKELQLKMPTSTCQVDSISVEAIGGFSEGSYLLLDAIYRISLEGYTYTSASCADCRYDGGTLTEPDFWE
jgi:hypothetical protein